jgi:hypothetical protein
MIGDFANRQQPDPEQLRVGSAEHRTLLGFEPVDLAFSLPIAPALDHGVADRLYVDHQGPCEVHDSWNTAVLGVVEPSVKPCSVMMPQQAAKADGQMAYRCKARHFLLQDREHSDWRSVSSHRGFMQIAAATTGEMREPDAGSTGSDRIACSPAQAMR